MKNLTLPVLSKRFHSGLGKTIVECKHQDSIITVFANGDHENSSALLANVTINEVGDTFVANRDSSKMAADGKTPLYKKGDTVTRAKQSNDFKSFAGNNRATEFAQGASAFGLQLIVQM